MMRAQRTLPLVAALITQLLGGAAIAEPRVGGGLPSFQVADVTGQIHRVTELNGSRTMIVVLTHRDAGEHARTWFERARARFGNQGIRYIALVSLDLPSVIPNGMVRNLARGHTPREYWHTTWLDRSDSLRRTLGLSRNDHIPYVYVLDPEGRVRAAVHRPFDTNAAQPIWSALDSNEARR